MKPTAAVTSSEAVWTLETMHNSMGDQLTRLEALSEEIDRTNEMEKQAAKELSEALQSAARTIRLSMGRIEEVV